MSNVVVTGAAGFIGSHTAEKLAMQGYEIIAVDNLSSGNPKNLAAIPPNRVTLVKADISNWRQLWEKTIQATRPGDVTGIIHLAAVINIVEVMKNPQHALDVNVKGTLNILELARRLDAQRVVLASSVAVYGEPQYLPIDEKHPLRPTNLYGETKLLAEHLLWHYQHTYGLKPIALRYFNVYGPRMRPGPYAGVVHKFITTLLDGDTPIIYGDGNQTRDFIYVEDVAEANLKALESSYTGPVNIGTGIETSINSLYQMICSTIGYCPKPRYMPPRPGDVQRSQAAIELAMEKLGWKPQTSLQKGLQKTIQHYLHLRRNPGNQA